MEKSSGFQQTPFLRAAVRQTDEAILRELPYRVNYLTLATRASYVVVHVYNTCTYSTIISTVAPHPKNERNFLRELKVQPDVLGIQRMYPTDICTCHVKNYY